MGTGESKKREDRPSRPASENVLIIIAAIMTILIGIVGVILEQYLEIAQFLVIVVTCGIVICVLVWLPKRTSEYTTDYLKNLDDRLTDLDSGFTKHCEITDEHRVKIGEEIGLLRQRVIDLCSELVGGTESRMSWIFFWSYVRDLRAKIEGESFHPDVVLSVGRSGAIVGALLAGNMGSLMHLGIDRINEWPEQKGTPHRVVKIVPPLDTISRQLEDKKVLCVMSECDTGMTLEKVWEELSKIKGAEVKTAVLFRNVNAHFIPDYIVKDDRGDRRTFPFRTRTWLRTSKGPPT